MDLILLVSEEIAYYLKRERKASIPGFGRFESEHQSASFDIDTNVLLAPYDKITFTPDLAEQDSSFTNYLTTYHQQIGLLDQFLGQVIESLTLNGKVILPELGVCSKTDGGMLHFTSEVILNDEMGFGLKGIKLHPIQITPQETIIADPNPPGASNIKLPKNKSRRGAMRVALLSLCVLFATTLIFNTQFNSAEDPAFQKVSAKYNVSPTSIENEVLISASDKVEENFHMDENQKSEIIKKQHLMTEVKSAPVKNIARIVTNTFGHEANVEKQLRLIASLGYQGDRLIKSADLVSTLIVVEYEDQGNLNAIFTTIKAKFPRAKLLP